ncbi:MAG: hypothetical protein IKH16_05835 [Selenomonadaceae bacterium]|nr:hypothetical protein [Selenomonadaceae bacterium]
MRGMQRLADAVARAVQKGKKGRPAERGILRGDSVQIGTRLYPRKLAVDMALHEGDVVWCQVTEDETLAVSVGA